jgi:hypothetical protein
LVSLRLLAHAKEENYDKELARVIDHTLLKTEQRLHPGLEEPPRV